LKIAAPSFRRIGFLSDVAELCTYGEACVLRERLSGSGSENVEGEQMPESAIVHPLHLREEELP
jgi:hypothetical protein